MTSSPIHPPFPSYEGNDPYIFICYAHTNADVVYADMEWLREEGINLWYDEGISPGRQWHDEIAESIDDCSLFVVFMSSAVIDSAYCKKEINFALQTGKELLVIYLEEVTLTLGLSLAVSDLQGIVRHKLANRDYKRKFLSHVKGLVEGPPMVHYPIRVQPASGRRYRNVLATVFMVALVIGTAFYFYDDFPDRNQIETASINFNARDWILLIVNNQTTNELFEGSLELALRVALQESKYVNLMSKSRVNDSLRRMDRAQSSLGIGLGLELAIRESLAAVVETIIAEQENTFVLTTNILDPVTKLAVFTHSETAETFNDVLSKLATSAEAIRKALGEPEDSIRSNKIELARATTSNLDALRIYSNAIDNAFKIPLEDTIDQLKQALKLDPDFALAHSRIATYTFAVDGDKSVARYHWAEASKHMDRLSQRERLIVEGARASLESPAEMLRRWRLLTRIYPDEYGAHNEIGLVLWYFFNDFSGAASSLQEVINIVPDNGIAYHNLGYCLLALGKTSEALAAFQKATETTTFVTGITDSYLVLGNINQASLPLKDADNLMPGDQIPRTIRLVGIEIDQGDLTTAYDLASEGLRISRDSRSPQSIIDFLGARLAISERTDAYDFPAHLAETQAQVEELYSADKLWRYPTKAYALMGKLAARNGQIAKAEELLRTIQDNTDHRGFPMAEDFENMLVGEIALAKGNPRIAMPIFEAVIERSNLFQAHESLARTYAALGESAPHDEKINWLIDHKGQALAEWSDSMFGREISLLDILEASQKVDSRL